MVESTDASTSSGLAAHGFGADEEEGLRLRGCRHDDGSRCGWGLTGSQILETCPNHRCCSRAASLPVFHAPIPRQVLMTDPQLTLRLVRLSDAAATLDAFGSDPSMSRQGTVTSLAEAEALPVGADRRRAPAPVRHLRRGPPRRAGVRDARRGQPGGLVLVLDQRVHRGRGWASTCATAVATWALSAGGCERLELGHRADNPLSGNVAGRADSSAKAGSRASSLIDGQRVDVLTYGRLATDPWPAATLEVSW